MSERVKFTIGCRKLEIDNDELELFKMDDATYGCAFAHIHADGTIERLDPADITIIKGAVVMSR